VGGDRLVVADSGPPALGVDLVVRLDEVDAVAVLVACQGQELIEAAGAPVEIAERQPASLGVEQDQVLDPKLGQRLAGRQWVMVRATAGKKRRTSFGVRRESGKLAL
jgi:hypothetical protein